ncbi:S1 RNA-binding domain-containing protein 1-like [Daphnia carinata]|uniref:S1 RNA-binding domain-containing protein 1-like n=1 Tax=Daphnia carinata TaxID=120202 RepID=UPI00257E79C2|nr:S1 RNA-binding domain-containing protein 1-like [Daphnia carinata]
MKRRNSENATEPIVKRTKSRWDVGPNDVENKGILPKCESKPNTQKFSGEAKWEIHEVLADSFGVPLPACKNFTSLIQEDCTLPFIARYRKEMIGNLDIEVLRKMKSSLEDLQKVQGKIVSVVKSLEKQSALTPSLNETICNIKDLDELEFCYAPFKDTKKRTLAAKARELGLESVAIAILEGKKHASLESLIKPNVEGLDSLKNVELGIQHVIADAIGKNKENVDTMSELVAKADARICVTKSRNASKQDPSDLAKFESYIDKTFSVGSQENSIKPHLFLAISRGEDLKILSVKITFPNHVESSWINYCERKYGNRGTDTSSNFRKSIVTKSIKDAYSRIVEPRLTRRIRSKLTEKSHHAAVDVFARNLKGLLLSPPLPNTTVLGLDPGFKHGCKCAAVSPSGAVLYTETIYIRFGERDVASQSAATSLISMVQKYGCTTIGLGNGKACRETEDFLSKLIQKGVFKPYDVRYTIINECGASIYSCSPEAKEEFPHLEPNLISAISIARRLQDPLTEYVRISPRHIGVGMYQHDIPVKQLEAALDDIVSECVSFVGVDINTCPEHVLSKVAGLSSNKAKKIIDYRNKKGQFVNRQQICDVPSLGPITFQQCAGFLTIPETSATDNSNDNVDKEPCKPKKVSRGKKAVTHSPNPLDRTCVHPESYQLAHRIIHMFKGNMEEIGHESFIRQLQTYLSTKPSKQIAKELRESEGKVDQIVLSLLHPLRYDLRTNFDKPLFKRSVTSIADLKIGQELRGRISNITDFGAFVDIGVGKDALVHTSRMRGKKEILSVTNQVSVRVINIDMSLERISLEII